MPKISIIVPVYNTEKHLKKCFDSLINQTLIELEIIIVNDGSKDDSQKIIDQYSKKDIRIKSFLKENGGLSDARNFGLKEASGDYISFIDSDDWVDLNMMAEMLKLANKHNADIVFCDLEKVNESGKSIRSLPQSPQLNEKIDLGVDLTVFGEMSCFACNKIFKKSLFDKHQFKRNIHFEDIELIPKLVLDSNVLAKINKPFYKYFERENSITKTHTEKGLDMFIAVENVAKYYRKSRFSSNLKELKRFQIIQQFYSYLAYVVFVKDHSLKLKMIKKLGWFLKDQKITNTDILFYCRFGSKYFLNLGLKKQAYYIFMMLIVSFFRKK